MKTLPPISPQDLTFLERSINETLNAETHLSEFRRVKRTDLILTLAVAHYMLKKYREVFLAVSEEAHAKTCTAKKNNKRKRCPPAFA